MSPSKLDHQAFTSTHRMFMMMAICMGAFISHFTAGIVNVSLPRFVNIFETSLSMVQWVTTGYLLVIASLLPVMGKLGDRYGYRLIHNLGYVCFSVSSILVAFSPNISVMIILRMVQAIGAAMFQATNIAIISIYLPKEKRGRALGMVSTAVAIGGMSGPIAGGFIAEWLSWQWLFLIHVPAALIATWLAFRYIPVRRPERKLVPHDRVGALLFIISIATVIYGISNGTAWGWTSSATIAVMTLAIVALISLLLWELRQEFPFLPLQALRNPAVSFGLIVSCASFVMANTVLVAMPFYLTGTAGLSPLTAGYFMTAYPVLLAFTGPVAGYLSDRYGSRRFMFFGLFAMGSGISFFALYPEQLPTVWIVSALAVIGLGMGLIASPNNSFIMQHAPTEQAGSIGGMIALTRNAGMVLGAALGLGVMNGGIGQGQAPLFQAFKAVFEVNVFICIGAMVILGYGIRLQARRGKSCGKDKASLF
ncbi:MFS transporter [Paenibacillus sp. OSY-SE]|uniref:MFS transporter n=1 Tax=Paenibacillus sp. OSY-SE TaxID=1196323 RepID=UPI0002EDDB6F|nr:MFS transporter [Paenibacillus sp. OSY-SE]